MTARALKRDATVVFLIAIVALVAGGDGVAVIATQLVMSASLVAWWLATGRRN